METYLNLNHQFLFYFFVEMRLTKFIAIKCHHILLELDITWFFFVYKVNRYHVK